jgi:hypothetical protein
MFHVKHAGLVHGTWFPRDMVGAPCSMSRSGAFHRDEQAAPSEAMTGLAAGQPEVEAAAAGIGDFIGPHAGDFHITAQPFARTRAGSGMWAGAGGGAVVAVVGADHDAHATSLHWAAQHNKEQRDGKSDNDANKHITRVLYRFSPRLASYPRIRLSTVFSPAMPGVVSS